MPRWFMLPRVMRPVSLSRAGPICRRPKNPPGDSRRLLTTCCQHWPARLSVSSRQEAVGMRRADRLFQIVQELRRRKLVTARQLAESLEVSERTIYRDITGDRKGTRPTPNHQCANHMPSY